MEPITPSAAPDSIPTEAPQLPATLSKTTPESPGARSCPDASPDESPNVSLDESKVLTQPSKVGGDNFYARAFAVVTTAVLGLALYRIIAPFLGSIMWALFLAFLLHPLHVRLSRRFKGRENISAALLTAATFIMLIGPLTAMSAAFVTQAGDLVQWAQDALTKQTRQQYRLLADLPLVGPTLEWTRNTFGIRSGQVQEWIAQATQHLPQFLASLGGQIFLGALNTVFAFVIMLFMLFFFVRDGAEFVGMLRDLIPMPTKNREHLSAHVAAVTRAVVFGTGITALAQGTLVGLAFFITGLSSPLVFAALAALLALLPFGGTAFVWIPAMLVLGAQNHYGLAVVMLVFGVLSSSVDNVLRPLLISGRAEVGTLTVFIGVLGGTTAFGPIGLFLGPVILALIIALIQFALEQRRAV